MNKRSEYRSHQRGVLSNFKMNATGDSYSLHLSFKKTVFILHWKEMWRFKAARKRGVTFALSQHKAAILWLSPAFSSCSPLLLLPFCVCVFVRWPTVAMSFLKRTEFGKSWWGMNRITAGSLPFFFSFFPCSLSQIYLSTRMSLCLRFLLT